MKAIFISFNQALKEDIISALDRNFVRGYTFWPELHGRGSETGEPHYGSHAWPVLNSALIAVSEDEKISKLMEDIRKLDKLYPNQGLRAFIWAVEEGM